MNKRLNKNIHLYIYRERERWYTPYYATFINYLQTGHGTPAICPIVLPESTIKKSTKQITLKISKTNTNLTLHVHSLC